MRYSLPKPRLPRRLPSLAGRGLPERMRTTVFAFLGLTAAAGLALVAVFAQVGFPLLAPAPLPSDPSRSNAVGEATVVTAGHGLSGLVPVGGGRGPRRDQARSRAGDSAPGGSDAGPGLAAVQPPTEAVPAGADEPAPGGEEASAPPASDPAPTPAPSPGPGTAPEPPPGPSQPEPQSQPAPSTPQGEPPAASPSAPGRSTASVPPGRGNTGGNGVAKGPPAHAAAGKPGRGHAPAPPAPAPPPAAAPAAPPAAGPPPEAPGKGNGKALGHAK